MFLTTFSARQRSTVTLEERLITKKISRSILDLGSLWSCTKSNICKEGDSVLPSQRSVLVPHNMPKSLLFIFMFLRLN